MSQSKSHFLLFGVAAGVAVGAAWIGLMLILGAVAIDFLSDSASVLAHHPLFIAGSKLVTTSLITGLPLFAIWSFWRKQ